jgi:hypothetical protein
VTVSESVQIEFLKRRIASLEWQLAQAHELIKKQQRRARTEDERSLPKGQESEEPPPDEPPVPTKFIQVFYP